MFGRKIHVEVWIGLGLMAFTLFFLSETAKFPKGTNFPQVVLGIFFLLAAILFVLAIVKTARNISKGDVKLEWGTKILKAHGIWGIMAGYVIMIIVIGFFPATIIASPVLMLYFGIRKIKVLVLVTIIMTLLVYFVFVIQLRSPLPVGILFGG